jgi:hypothetical protein
VPTVADPLGGEKNGKKCGLKLNIVQKNAGEINRRNKYD